MLGLYEVLFNSVMGSRFTMLVHNVKFWCIVHGYYTNA